jgi:hypothetical protein
VRVITSLQIEYKDSRRIAITLLTSTYVLNVVYVHTCDNIMYIGTIRIRTNMYVRKYNISLLLIEQSLAK